jgi:hypothetical protein
MHMDGSLGSVGESALGKLHLSVTLCFENSAYFRRKAKVKSNRSPGHLTKPWFAKDLPHQQIVLPCHSHGVINVG